MTAESRKKIIVNQKNRDPGSKKPVGAPPVWTISMAFCFGFAIPNKFIFQSIQKWYFLLSFADVQSLKKYFLITKSDYLGA